MNKIEIKTEIGISEMNNNYKTIRGVIAVLFSLASAAGLVFYWNQFSGWQKALMLFFALMFTVIEPVEYYFRSKRQVKKNFTVPLSYGFDENGIEIRQNDEKAHNDWQDESHQYKKISYNIFIACPGIHFAKERYRRPVSGFEKFNGKEYFLL